jgi:hypothetical protein
MMTQSNDQTLQHYLSDLGKLLIQNAREVKHARETATSVSSRDYESGRLMGYNEVISLMQQQAIAFGLSLQEVALEGIDPDTDLT